MGNKYTVIDIHIINLTICIIYIICGIYMVRTARPMLLTVREIDKNEMEEKPHMLK